MQTTIFSLIDLLTNMLDTKESFESIQDSITKINENIPNLKNEYDKLRITMTDDKYFDASGEIVDRNIEISVVKKIGKLEHEKELIQQEIKNLSRETKKYYEAIDLLKQKILKAKESSSLLEKRIETLSDDSTRDLYLSIIELSKEKMVEFGKQLTEKNNDLQEKESELEEKINRNSEVEELIEKYTSRLLEVRNSLANKSAYVDEDEKAKDLDKLNSIQQEINDLEEEKKRLASSPIIYSVEAKDYLMSGENDKALERISRLVELINDKPYMSVQSQSDLKEELSHLEEKQQELLTLIENKKYVGNNEEFLKQRIDHLNGLIEYKKSEIDDIKRRIDNSDNVLVKEVSNLLKNAEIEAIELNKSIDNYYNLMNAKTLKSSVTIENLKASYTKKMNDLKVINNLIQKYELELSNLIRYSNKLESNNIIIAQKVIESYEEEIDELNKLLLTNVQIKDVIEQENDKKQLREIMDNIKLLKNRLTYKKSANEIYDEIEMLLTSKDSGGAILNSNDFIVEEENNAIENELETEIDFEDTIENDYDDKSLDESETNLDMDLNDDEPNLEIDLNDDLRNKFQSLLEDDTDEEENQEIIMPIINDDDMVISNERINDISEKKGIEKSDLLREEESSDIPSVEENVEEKNDFENDLSNNMVDSIKADDEEEFQFSELDDTGYFNLDDFLKEMKDEK